MRNTLYIRLRAADPGAQTAYCIAAPQALASFDVRHAPLETVLSLATGHRLVVLVPGADLRFAHIEVPARQAAKVLQAAPFALEEQLAEDVDTLHFALGPRQPDGRWPVAVVARAKMEAWLQPFRDRGLTPDVLVPDVLCLPPADGERWSVLTEPDQILVRNGPFMAFSCLPQDLDLCLQLADPDRKAVLRIVVPRDVVADFDGVQQAVELLPGFQSPLEALLQQYRPENSINLLQGSYSTRQDVQRLWLPWRRTAVLLGVWLGLSVLLYGVSSFRLERELQRQHTANVERYQQLFPAETRIVDLSVQVDRQFAVLKAQGSRAGLLPLMAVLADALQAAPALQLQTVQYRDGALYAALTGTDLQQLEALRQWFASPRPAQLEVQSANAGSDGAQIRIKLTPV